MAGDRAALPDVWNKRGTRTDLAPDAMRQPRNIWGWSVNVTCPGCGGVLEHQADGRPTPTTARALANCTACQRVWAAQLTLSDVTTDTDRRRTRQQGSAA